MRYDRKAPALVNLAGIIILTMQNARRIADEKRCVQEHPLAATLDMRASSCHKRNLKHIMNMRPHDRVVGLSAVIHAGFEFYAALTDIAYRKRTGHRPHILSLYSQHYYIIQSTAMQ